jgi:hypothetical protein
MPEQALVPKAERDALLASKFEVAGGGCNAWGTATVAFAWDPGSVDLSIDGVPQRWQMG